MPRSHGARIYLEHMGNGSLYVNDRVILLPKVWWVRINLNHGCSVRRRMKMRSKLRLVMSLLPL